MTPTPSTSCPARLRTELGTAVPTGLVVGALFGVREGLLTLDANAFVQPGQYFFVYLAGAILVSMTLGVLVLVPVAGARALLGRARASGLPLYVALAVGGGTLSVVGPWLAAVVAHLNEVGFAPGPAGTVALWTAALALVAGAGVAAGGTAAWWAARTAHPLRWATRLAVALLVVLPWPLVRFVATEWKWDPPRPSAAAASERPNVVLVSIDTLRADPLASYGGTPGVTPHLDRVAAEGVTFRNAIVAAPWTLPSVGSIMTGLYPRHHGAGAPTNRRDPLGRSRLADGPQTLAAWLRAAGYRTHAVVTNPYLALRYGLGRGFDGYENLTIESEFFLAGRDATLIRLLRRLCPGCVVGDRGATVSRRAIAWLEGARDAGPFFLWVHYIDAHPPYGASRHKTFRGDTVLGATRRAPAMRVSPDPARLRSGEIQLSAAEKETVRALYRDEVAGVDAAVGEVVDALDRLGLGDRTLLVVASDHGEEFWEHGGVEHGHTVYDELVRVPLLMRMPGRLPAGAVVDGIARTVDVAPTVAELVGAPAFPACDGASLLPLVRGENEAPRVALVENMLFAAERIGIRTADRKYVRWASGKEEVYDLAADPGEQRDLAGVASVVAPLRAAAADVEHVLAARATPVAAPAASATVGALRSLGYVE